MRVLDLFSGIGGFSIGLEAAGMKTVAFCEIEPFCRSVLKKHWPDTPCHDDVTKLDGKQYAGIDVICGGFPCQDISLAGKGAGLAGERSGLWFEYRRIIQEAQPRYVIIENVSALRSRGLDKVLGSLAEIGYDAEWHCIPASAVGAPHRRDRIWIIAYPNDSLRQARTERPRREKGANPLGRSAGPNVANGTSLPRDERLDGLRLRQDEQEGIRVEAGASRETLAHTTSGREQQSSPRCDVGGLQEAVLRTCGDSNDWDSEPNICRVVDGVPLRIHRLRCLGNSIVPKIAQVIGQAIIKREEERK